jgi:hypothetical protein
MKGVVVKRLVLDASVAVAWCFEDETTGFTEAVLDLLLRGTQVLTPAIWPLEVASIIECRAPKTDHCCSGHRVASSHCWASRYG